MTHFTPSYPTFSYFRFVLFQDPKPDYEQILKDEFAAHHLHFEANVSDGAEEGKFVFELAVFPKCGNCVFECPHLGRDKILAFRYTLNVYCTCILRLD